MTAVSAPRPGWELLAGQVNQRRYEALRAYLYEGLSLQQAADAAGYTRSALASLVRDLRAGKVTVFAPPGVPGRKGAPKKDAARGRVIELRREGLPVYEISMRVTREGTPLGRSAVSDILGEDAPPWQASSASPARPTAAAWPPAHGSRPASVRRPAACDSQHLSGLATRNTARTAFARWSPTACARFGALSVRTTKLNRRLLSSMTTCRSAHKYAGT